MCYFNRLTRVARWLADYPKWLLFCWDFVKPPRKDEIALQHFFFLFAAVQEFFLFHLCCMQLFSSKQHLQEIFFQNHGITNYRITRHCGAELQTTKLSELQNTQFKSE